MMEDITSVKIICQGGLNSSRNNIQLSDQDPGGAWELTNYEPGLFGGYRRLDGFTLLDADYGEVDPSNAEGKIFCVAIFNGTIIAARKLQSGNTYNFYYYQSGVGWTGYTTGLTLNTTDSGFNVNKIRWATFNFNGTEKIIFVDGVNNATLFDGTNWINIDPAATGADFANAGGAQVLGRPSLITVFKNHIFLSGDPEYPHLVCHSAPVAEYDWTSGNGAGQLIASKIVKQIKPFRDTLFVFGFEQIKKIEVQSNTFVINDVTTNVGCIASDSVVEIGGDLLFLSQDGFRPIAATARIGDVELETVSKKIQQLITDYITSQDLTQLNSVVIRSKSQVRFFFSDGSADVGESLGIIGGLRGTLNGDILWEWGKILGIRTSCTCSDYIGTEEYILHGDHDGMVYRQEQGNSFNGESIYSNFTTPYLDFGDINIRKTLRKVKIFVRAEGDIELSCQVDLDWGDPDVQDPGTFLFENVGTVSTYGTAIYGTSVYGDTGKPVLIQNVQGTGFSFQFAFTATDMNRSHSIQGIVYEFSIEGRK